MKRLVLLSLGTILLLFFSNPVHPQQSLVDSLEKVLLDHSKEDTKKVDLLVQLSFAYRNTNPKETRRVASQVRDLSLRLNYQRGLGQAHQLEGISYAIQGDFSHALTPIIRAIDIFEELGDLEGIAKNNSNLAGIFYALGNKKKAAEYANKALEVIKKTNNEEGIATTQLAVGVIQEGMGKYDEALESYTFALDHFKKTKNSQRLASTYQSIGDLYMSKKDLTRSLRYYEMSLKTREAIGDKTGKATTLVAIAELNEKLGQTDQAYRSLNMAIIIAKELELNNLLMYIYKQFATLDARKGNFASAYKNQMEYDKYKDIVFQQTNNQELTRLEKQHQMEQELQSTRLFQTQNDLQKAKLSSQEGTIRTQRIIAGGIGVITIISLILAFVLWQNRRRIKASNDLLLQEKEANEEKALELTLLNQTKDQWFALMCHDFKQPFSFLEGALGLLNERKLSPQEQEMLLGEMEDRVKNHSLVLDNIIYWAQDQQQAIVVRKEKLDMEQIISETLFLMDSLVQKKKISFVNHIDHRAQVWADRNMVHLVVRNLLTNALKLSDTGQQVKIHSQIQDDMLIVHVIDSGISIPKDYLDKLFDFDSRRIIEGFAKERGLGVNLLVSRDFIHKNGGEVWVRNLPGRGNVFSFSLPYAGPELPNKEEVGKDFLKDASTIFSDKKYKS